MSGNDNEQKTKASKNDSCLKSFKLRKKIEPLHISSVRQRRCSMYRTGGGEWAGQAMGNGHGRKWVHTWCRCCLGCAPLQMNSILRCSRTFLFPRCSFITTKHVYNNFMKSCKQLVCSVQHVILGETCWLASQTLGKT